MIFSFPAMASSSAATQKGWVHPRKRPVIPPGTNWEILFKKFALPYYLTLLKARRVGNAFISCHRTLYDRARGIMENSLAGYENGMSQGLFGHEIDGRLRNHVNFGAHDERQDRVTSATGRWEDFDTLEILRSKLVIRNLTPSGDGYDVTYVETDQNIPLMDDLLNPDRGQTVQIDMRKDDLGRAIAWLCRRPLFFPTAMLKGYNFNYSSYEDVHDAAMAAGAPKNWADLIAWTLVIHTSPLMDAAFRTLGVDPADRAPEQYRRLTYDLFQDIAMEQILSFVERPHKGIFVPEIGFSGLGLGYDKETGTATNPYDGTHIIDPKVAAEALLDRVLIDIACALKDQRPNIKLGSCARLYDAATPDGRRYVSSLETTEAESWPSGEPGIAHFLRAVPGGLYPETDFCNADDPLREIAARAWIEYGKLDRRQLLTMTYLEWIKQAGEEVENALKALNGPFLPNVFEL
ncbi:hypothetical protein ACCS93_35750 [Rhizobium ruizarguesonis]